MVRKDKKSHLKAGGLKKNWMGGVCVASLRVLQGNYLTVRSRSRRIHHIRFPFGSAGCLSCSSNFTILLQRKRGFATKLILSELPHIPNYFYKYPSADSMEPAILNFSHSSGNFFAVSFMQSTNSLLFVFSTISSQTSLIQEN